MNDKVMFVRPHTLPETSSRIKIMRSKLQVAGRVYDSMLAQRYVSIYLYVEVQIFLPDKPGRVHCFRYVDIMRYLHFVREINSYMCGRHVSALEPLDRFCLNFVRTL
jgi:hypothetical protein